MMSTSQVKTSQFSLQPNIKDDSTWLIFDLESDGLYDEATEIYCIVCYDIKTNQTFSYGPDNIHDGLRHLQSANFLIGHNILFYDCPLIQKLHEGKVKNKKSIEIWGTGKVKREFIHVDDMADGIIHIIKNYDDKLPINLGTGEEISIKDLAFLIKKVVDYKGEIFFDKTKPDGIKRKILDNSKIKKLKWVSKINLEDGITSSYKEYIKNL